MNLKARVIPPLWLLMFLDKLITFIDLLEAEKNKKARGGANPEALEAARVAMQHAEDQIRTMQDTVQKTEERMTKKDEDVCFEHRQTHQLSELQ